ncbi:hypothetical protein [Kocuria rosea]|uniref:hypothetical protein n=1 Tax=Kocuria rosea TaxID=1275 RepID=UPI000AA1E836|nr:hypothetical protein [Kocuria polaris]
MFETHETLIIPETLELQQAGFGAALSGTMEGSQVRDVLADPAIAALIEDTPDNLQVYRGKSVAKRYGIGVQGSGAKAKGRISGTFTGYDYTRAYQVYNLPSNTSAKYWFITYSRSSNNSALKEVAGTANTTRLNYNLEFELTGNDRGITSVFIYFETIRLKFNGQTKDFVVTNPESSGAAAPDGTPYPGGFTPIEQSGGG